MKLAGTGGLPRASVALAAGMLTLAGCGSGKTTSPEEAIAELAEACAAAGTTLAAAPAPADAEGEAQFREAHKAAVRAVFQATSEAREHVDDPALGRMERVLGALFPVVQGGWTERSTAAQTLGSIHRVTLHASAAGVPECGGDLWRNADWETIYARHAGGRPSEAAFVAEVETLCASTLTFTTLGESGVVGAAVAASTASRGLSTFVRELNDVVPPESLEAGYVALLGAASEFREAVPDVPGAVDPSAADAVNARIQLAASDTQDAASALGVAC